MQVYVILFGVGESETEGIYTVKLQVGDKESSDDVDVDVVLAFENLPDAL